MPPRGTSEIPLAFANILSRGRCTESELEKCFPQLSSETKTNYFVAIQEEKKTASLKDRSDIKSNEAHLVFRYPNLFEDIGSNLELVCQYTMIVKHKLAKLGQLSVKRIRQDHLDIYFLSHVSDETVKALISFSSQTGHPGGVIVPAVNGFMSEDSYNRLCTAGFELFGLNTFFCIRNNRFAVSDLQVINRILESDDSLCADEKWVPQQVSILDKPFLVELPPSWYNMWKRAYETDQYNDSDEQFYEEQKEWWAFVVVNEETTLEFKVNFKIDPSFFWKDWSIKEEIIDPVSSGKKKGLYIAGVRCADTSILSTTITSDGCRTRIQRQRIDNANQRAVVSTGQSDSAKPPASNLSKIAIYPLTLGKITVIDKDWKFVSFGSKKKLPLGGQKAAVLKALYELHALNHDSARPLEEILKEANLAGHVMSLKKPFSSNSSLKSTYTALYASCVKFTGAEGRKGKGRGVRDGKYYLDVGASS